MEVEDEDGQCHKHEEKAVRENIYIPEQEEEIELAEFKKGKEGSSKKDWEKYQEMPLKEKRKLYKCRNNFKKLEDIETWPEYFKNRGMKSDKPVDQNINDKVSLWKGDITTLEIDAIVNAANNSLLGGGGVDGCIHRAAGPTLKEECRTKGGCKTGDAKITSGHKLPAKYVIHTVGPIGKHEKDLQSCYEKCLELTLENNIKTLAFCCISTGIYGYPNEDAAKVALSTTRNWLENNSDAVDRIIFCLFLDKDIKIYETLMFKYFPPWKLERPDNQSNEIESLKAEDKPLKADGSQEKELTKESSEREKPVKESAKKKLRIDTKESNEGGRENRDDKRRDDDRSKENVQSGEEMSEREIKDKAGERTKTVAQDVQNGKDAVEEISVDETRKDQDEEMESKQLEQDEMDKSAKDEGKSEGESRKIQNLEGDVNVDETPQEESVDWTKLEQEQTNKCEKDVIMPCEDKEQIKEHQISEGKNTEVVEVENTNKDNK